LLTDEELQAEEIRLAKKREYNNAYYHKRQAEKSPKPLTKNMIIKRHYAGLPLTDEEFAIYRAWQDKKTAQNKKWRHRKKTEKTA